MTRPKLMKAAWKKFSIHVRKSVADWRGYVACVTCGKVYKWDSGMIHAGHWIHDKLDFDPRNIHPQCRDCNYKYNKNANISYAIFMARTYGIKEMEAIKKLAQKKGNNYSTKELKKIINAHSTCSICSEKQNQN